MFSSDKTHCLDCDNPSFLRYSRSDGRCRRCKGSGSEPLFNLKNWTGYDKPCFKCNRSGECQICAGTGLVDNDKSSAKRWTKNRQNPDKRDSRPDQNTSTGTSSNRYIWELEINAKPLNSQIKKSRKIESHVPSGMLTALIVMLVIAGLWELGYRYMKASYAGTGVEVSRFPPGAVRPNPTKRRKANQHSYEQTCKEREVNWTRDNIYLTNEADGIVIISSKPDYIVRTGDLVTICAEAGNLQDLRKLYMRVGKDQIVGPDQTTWQPALLSGEKLGTSG